MFRKTAFCSCRPAGLRRLRASRRNKARPCGLQARFISKAVLQTPMLQRPIFAGGGW